jgi:hypothetical protein
VGRRPPRLSIEQGPSNGSHLADHAGWSDYEYLSDREIPQYHIQPVARVQIVFPAILPSLTHGRAEFVPHLRFRTAPNLIPRVPDPQTQIQIIEIDLEVLGQHTRLFQRRHAKESGPAAHADNGPDLVPARPVEPADPKIP